MKMIATLLPLLLIIALYAAVIGGIVYIIVKAVKKSTSRRDQYLEQIQMQLVHLQHEVERLREIVEGGNGNDKE